jgi:hypothetical protein
MTGTETNSNDSPIKIGVPKVESVNKIFSKMSLGGPVQLLYPFIFVSARHDFFRARRSSTLGDSRSNS